MQNKIRFLALFILMFGLMVAGVSAQDSINVGDTVEGNASNAEVEYSVSLSAGESILVDLVSDFSSKVRILDSAGNEVGGGEGGGANWYDTRTVFIAPADDTYTIVLATYFGTPSGDYTLTVAEQEITPLTYGETFTSDVAEGTIFAYYTFEGAAGDVVNIFANAFDDNDDLRLTLYGVNGEEIANDDDGGQRFNPYIRRHALSADGTYIIFLERIFDREMVGNYEITVEATETLDLASGEFEVTLGEALSREVFTLNVRSGAVYVITLAATGTGANASVEIVGANSTFYDNRFDADAFLGATFTFRAGSTGQTSVVLRHRGFSGATTYTISIVEQ